MDRREELRDHFQFMGYSVGDGEVLDKCVDMCQKYSRTGEEIAEMWFAFAANSSDNASPSLEGLANMERKGGLGQPRTCTPNESDVLDRGGEITDPTRFDAPISPQSTVRLVVPKSVLVEDATSDNNSGPPLNVLASCDPSETSTLDEQVVCTTDDSCGVRKSTYPARKDAGLVVSSYGIRDASRICGRQNAPDAARRSAISVLEYGDDDDVVESSLTSKERRRRYMYEVAGAKAANLNANVQWMGNSILKKHKVAAESLTGNTGASGHFTTYGRIVSATNEKLKQTSIMLEGSREAVLGQTVTLNLGAPNNYAVFPGQIVAAQGERLTGGKFAINRLFTDAPPPPPPPLPSLTGPLRIVVAAGPYTLQDNLLYQPLQDLIEYVTEKKPDILILIGPFVDINNDNIRNGLITETFDALFESLIEGIATSLKDSDTRIVLIPSGKDAHHHVVYPTPPYVLKNEQRYANVLCVSDPCMLNVNGLMIGATSADVLFHLGREEFCWGSKEDRLGRLVSYLLNQQSFYPLYPPNGDMSIDHEIMERFGLMEVMPHILIVPSTFKSFVKNIRGCLAINPERLTKTFVGGTFATLEIPASNSNELSSICNIVEAEIVRI